MRGYFESDGKQKLTTYQVNGKEVDIYITSGGEFRASVNGKTLKAPTIDALRVKMRKAGKVARVKISVPATIAYISIGRMLALEVVLTGVNEKTGAILYRDEKTGRADQERDRFGSDKFTRRLTDVEVAKLRRLHAAHLAAQSAYQDYRRAIDIDASALIKEAIEEAADKEPDVEEEPTGDPRVDPQPKGRKR